MISRLIFNRPFMMVENTSDSWTGIRREWLAASHTCFPLVESSFFKSIFFRIWELTWFAAISRIFVDGSRSVIVLSMVTNPRASMLIPFGIEIRYRWATEKISCTASPSWISCNSRCKYFCIKVSISSYKREWSIRPL